MPPLPVGDFRFLDDEEIRRFELNSIKPDNQVGYFVECDLEYPTYTTYTSLVIAICNFT